MNHSVPAAPFLERIDREADRLNWTMYGPDPALGGLDKVCARLGIGPRAVRRWRATGRMSFDKADVVLTGLGLEHHWHEPELAPYYAPPAPVAPAPRRPSGSKKVYRADALQRTEQMDEWQFEEAA